MQAKENYRCLSIPFVPHYVNAVMALDYGSKGVFGIRSPFPAEVGFAENLGT